MSQSRRSQSRRSQTRSHRWSQSPRSQTRKSQSRRSQTRSHRWSQSPRSRTLTGATATTRTSRRSPFDPRSWATTRCSTRSSHLTEYKLFWERVDCATISEALHLDAVRRCPDSGMFDVLYSFSKRAVSIGPDGIGWVPVLMRPGRRPPGMRGRLFCGIGKLPDPQPKASAKKKAKKQEEEEPDPRKSFIDKLPPEIQKELTLGVPDQPVGRSAFAFKKLVRYIVRCRLGSVEVDICNAFFQLLHKIVPLPGALAEYLDNREEKLEAIGHALLSSLPPKERRKEAKRLLIRLGFGGSFANWAATEVGRVPLQSDVPPVGPLASWLYRFESEARQWHTAVFPRLRRFLRACPLRQHLPGQDARSLRLLLQRSPERRFSAPASAS